MSPDPPRTGYLSYVHVFRAAAMMLVVGQHASWVFDWSPSSVDRPILADVLDNSSCLFVFLSGFLFHHLADRYRYSTFLASRARSIVLPYLVVAAPAVVLTTLVPRLSVPYQEVDRHPAPYRALWFLVHGSTMINVALWFVPMIVVFFLASPLLVQLVRRPRGYWVLVVLVPFSMLAHRPAVVPDADVLQLAAYYLSAYVFGMWVSQFRSRFEPLARRLWWLLVAAFVLAVVAAQVLGLHHGNYEGSHLFSEEHGVLDWIFAEKLLLCVALMATFHRFDHRLAGVRSLRWLGSASFGIYLVHCYLVNAVKLAAITLGATDGTLVSWLLTCAVALGGSALIVAGVRRVFGRFSLYLIGSTSPRTPVTASVTAGSGPARAARRRRTGRAPAG